MSWNYRAVRRQYKDHEEIGIYSVYYDAEGNIKGMSIDPAPVSSYSMEELKDLLELMAESLQEPLLEYELQDHECVARAKAATDVDELRELYAIASEDQTLELKDSIEVIQALVRNPSTPVDVLTSISQLRNFQRAPQLRHEAKNALSQRNQKESD